MPRNESLRILCFGDSLTSGFCQYGLDSHPYSSRLKDRLSGAFDKLDFEIITNGLPGDVATFPRFTQRLKDEYERRWFDWVIILGGTNDLGMGIAQENVFTALQSLYDFCLSKNSKVLALTVPECHAKSSRLDRNRDSLNSSILSYKQPNYHAFDLKKHIPYHSLSEDDKGRYWDDGLHLTPDGYDWMGGHIADAFTAILRGEKPAGQGRSTANPASAPKKSGETTLDEESGNPRNINEGYVVVRKHDLY